MPTTAEETLSEIQRLIDSDCRSSMSPGMTACITIVVVVVIAVVIALFMTRSPQGIQMMQKKKIQSRTGRKNSPVKKIATAMQQAQNRFSPMNQESRLSSVPGLNRSSTSSMVPSMLQSKNPTMSFSGMQGSNKLASIPGMSASQQSVQSNPQPMFTSQQIKKGLNNSSLYNASPQQQVTRHPRGNSFQNLWLHGDVNSKQSRAGPTVSTQSMWQELP